MYTFSSTLFVWKTNITELPSNNANLSNGITTIVSLQSNCYHYHNHIQLEE